MLYADNVTYNGYPRGARVRGPRVGGNAHARLGGTHVVITSLATGQTVRIARDGHLDALGTAGVVWVWLWCGVGDCGVK